jgi:hypothetical protein
VSAVCFDSGGADIEKVRHFFVGATFGEQLQDLAFAVGQQIEAVVQAL